MRILVAPDKFAGTLTAVQAAEAIARGWLATAPRDGVDTAPLSDGGPGFVDVIHAALGGRLLAVRVSGPLGGTVPATLLVAGGARGASDAAAGATAYVEAAQACGLDLVPADRRDPGATTTYGVGELLFEAVRAGPRRIVVGLGGSATNDGGAGMLAALGAEPAGALSRGGAALATLATPRQVELEPARRRLGDLEIVIASDVDNPLLGLRGASNVFGPQKGATAEQVADLDAALARFADAVGPGGDRPAANAKGAGAAGGLGYGLMLLGGRRVSGIETVLGAIGLEDRMAAADLVVTGEGCFDVQSLRGKVASGVAGLAGRYAKPCIVLAGQVRAGRRELGAMGVESAYSVADTAGSPEAAMAEPDRHLQALAARVARTWSRP